MYLPSTRTIIIPISPTEHAISEFMESFRASFPSSSISLKMHLLEDHTVPWARRTGTGFGLLGKQGAESIHARFNTLQRTYQCIHNKVDRLLSIVKEHSLSINFTQDCGIYSTAKQTSTIVGSQHKHFTPFRAILISVIRIVLANTAAQTTVYFTRVYHREEKVWLQFHTIRCKYFLSPFVLYFQLGSRICLRGPKSTLKSMRSSKNGRL